MKRADFHIVAFLSLCIIFGSAVSCGTTGGSATASAPSLKATAAASINTTARSFDVLMTLVGNSYRAGMFGTPGSPNAERVRADASRISRGVSASVYSALVAIDQGRDATQFTDDLAKAITEISALLPPPVKRNP